MLTNLTGLLFSFVLCSSSIVFVLSSVDCYRYVVIEPSRIIAQRKIRRGGRQGKWDGKPTNGIYGQERGGETYHTDWLESRGMKTHVYRKTAKESWAEDPELGGFNLRNWRLTPELHRKAVPLRILRGAHKWPSGPSITVMIAYGSMFSTLCTQA